MSTAGRTLDQLFHLRERGTDVTTELDAGLSTFLTMAYIVVVNPSILAQAGVPFEGALFATCVASAIATLFMGVFGNFPFALAPGMGLNAYFAFSVVGGLGCRGRPRWAPCSSLARSSFCSRFRACVRSSSTRFRGR